MRSRTEMVTTTLDGSDFDEDSDFEDSEEDWKPEKGEQKSLKRKSRDIITGSGGGSRRGPAGRANGKKGGRKPAAKGRAGRKRKAGDTSDEEEDDADEDEDDDDQDDEEEEDEPSDSDDYDRSTTKGRKRARTVGSKVAGGKRTNGRKTSTKTSPSTSKRAAASCELALKPIARKVVNLASSFPDKSGNLKLYAFRGDLEEGIRDNLKVCLWRRDGSSLLQKYFRDKSVDASTPQFTSSMVYSCWEDKRSDEYMEVKVRCIEQSKQLRVQIVDVDTVDKKAKEEYERFIARHGKSGFMGGGGAGGRSNGNGRGAGSRSRKSRRARSDDPDEEDDDEDNGADGSDESEEDELDDEEQEAEDERADEPDKEAGAPGGEPPNVDGIEEDHEEPVQEE